MIHHSKLKQCFKIRLESGKEIIVSGDHIFPTKRGRISILSGGLEVGDYLHSTEGTSNE
jgi:intein/homing endonuclease